MILEIANFGRLQLAELLHELDFKVGVEIGVAQGWYSNEIMKRNPQMKLYGVDPWISYEGYTDYKLKSTFKGLIEAAHARLDRYPNYEFVQKFSADALKDFEDNSLDFVYIDGNHADPYVSEDISGWWKKLRCGGILAGHDYTRSKGKTARPPRNDTIDATNRFAKENNRILYILGTRVIREDEVRDKVRSWLIQK